MVYPQDVIRPQLPGGVRQPELPTAGGPPVHGEVVIAPAPEELHHGLHHGPVLPAPHLS